MLTKRRCTEPGAGVGAGVGAETRATAGAGLAERAETFVGPSI